MESGCVTFPATTAQNSRTLLLRPEGQGLNLFDTVQEGLWFRSPGSLIPAFCAGTNRPREGTGTWSQSSTRTKEGADGRQ